MEFVSIPNDTSGNPRWVVHFLQCEPEAWKANNLTGRYERTCTLMKQIGGRKFHNKQYGGGIAFVAYNLEDLEKKIENLKGAAK